MYVEILATALASDVVTKSEGVVKVISGDIERRLLEQFGNNSRVLAFRQVDDSM